MNTKAKARLPTNLCQTLQTHSGPINAITFSNLGGTYILTGSSDRQIHLLRSEASNATVSDQSSTKKSNSTSVAGPVVTTQPIQRYTSHGYAVLSISVSSQNTHFASSGGDRALFYWDIQTANTTLRRFGTNTSQSHTSRITSVTFAGGGGGGNDSVLISGSDDRTVRLWDVKSHDPRPLQVWEEAKDGVSCVVVPPPPSTSSAAGYEVLTGSVDGRVRAYDLRLGRVVTDVQPGPVTSLDLTSDSKCVLVGCLDGKIRLMDRDNGACLRAFPADAVHAAGYQNDTLRLQSCLAVGEELVLSGSEGDGKVRAWNVLSGNLVDVLDVSEKVVSVTKWREGSTVQNRKSLWAAGGVDGMVRIYEP